MIRQSQLFADIARVIHRSGGGGNDPIQTSGAVAKIEEPDDPPAKRYSETQQEIKSCLEKRYTRARDFWDDLAPWENIWEKERVL